MARLPVYDRQVTAGANVPKVMEGAESQTAAVIADAAGGIARRISRMADRAAQNEGAMAGMAAGLDREFRPSRASTLRGEAFDRAGIQTFVEMRESEMRTAMEEIATANPDNPDALATALDGQLQRMLADLGAEDFPELQVSLTAGHARLRTTLVRDAIRRADDRRREHIQGSLVAAIDARMNQLGRAATVNGLDDEADAVIAGELAALQSTLDGAVAAGAMTPAQREKALIEARNQTVEDRVMGTLQRLSGPAARQQFLVDFDTDYTSGKGPLAGLDSGAYRVLRARIEASIEADATQAKKIVKQLDDGFERAENAAAEGLPFTRAQVLQLDQTARATGDEDMIARADLAQQRMTLAALLQRQTPAQLQTVMRGMQQKAATTGLSAEEQRQYDVAGKVQTAMDRMLKSDPYQWGLRAGVLKDAPDLNLAGDAATLASLQERRAAQAAMASRYGQVPFFTDAERSALKHIARQGGDQMLALSQMLVNGLGSDAPAALAEIEKDAPELAHLAGMSMGGGNTETAREAAAMLALRQREGYKAPSFSDGLKQASGEYFGPAFGGMESFRRGVEQTAMLLLESRAAQRGIAKLDIEDEDVKALWEEALDEAAGARMVNGVKHGGMTEVNGRKVIAPPDMAADEVENRLRAIDADDLKSLPPIRNHPSRPIGPRDLQGARLVSAGDGLYRVALGDPASADPRYLAAPDGGFWTLDIRRLKAVQGGRDVRTLMQRMFGG